MPSATEQVIHLSQAAGANDRLEEESQKTGSSPLGLSLNEPNPVKMPNESTVNASAPDFTHQHGNFPLRNDFPGPMSLRGHPELVPSSSFVSGVTPQPGSFQGDLSVKNAQSFPVENLASESSKQSFQNHLLAQKRPPYGPHLTAVESSVSSHLGGSKSMPGYSSSTLDKDNPSSFFDVGGSRISTHYNPYASTFDQPLSTRFSSIAFTQERGDVGGIKYDGQSAGDHGSRQIISSSNSSKFSSRHNVLDVEENNKQKVVGAVPATVSLENDEFGETADAEVGAVENGSPSSPNEDADVAEGGIEIDQVKSEGRSKKNKDSRSMNCSKLQLQIFVKEVLKPQWRQGI
uniref:Uncharacterized protein n=1 Tax=Chenopodium quinoa TaxID=63459 RepID=A0A803N345_CHEQI